MKATTRIVWKEWHETRIFLWIALGIFVGLPIIGGIEAVFQKTARHFEMNSGAWVIAFSGILAVFVAVSTTCRDFSGHLEDFWRSRPISVPRWMLLKFVVGLMVVLVACELPLVLEYWINHDNDLLRSTIGLPFAWCAAYAVAFLAGCLLRRTAHAAMIAMALLLLIWFIPIVVPALNWMSLDNFMQQTYDESGKPIFFSIPQAKTAAALLCLTALALALSVIAVRNDWHIESGRRLMYGSIAAALLLFAASATFQFGTELPVIQSQDLQVGQRVYWIHMNGNEGYAGFVSYQARGSQGQYYDLAMDKLSVCKIALSDQGFTLGPPITNPYAGYIDLNFFAPGNPRIAYFVQSESESNPANNEVETESYQLRMLDVTGQSNFALVPLWSDKVIGKYPAMYAWQNRLYVMGTHLMEFDITDPASPKKISESEFNYYNPRNDIMWMNLPDTLPIELPPIPNLPPRQRLDAAMRIYFGWGGIDLQDNLLCLGNTEYRLKTLTDVGAVFEKVGAIDEPIVDRVFGRGGGNWAGIQNGFIFLQESWGNGVFNPQWVVVDAKSKDPLKVIGHFANPGAEQIYPLPDGRAFVTGSKIWLLGAPPRKAGQ